MRNLSLAPVVLLWCCGAAVARGQAFNIAFGDAGHVGPSSGFGAASGQTGYWNAGAGPLRDTSGSLTDVQLSFGDTISWHRSLSGPDPDAIALLGGLAIGTSFIGIARVSNLPVGKYRAFAYVWGNSSHGSQIALEESSSGAGKGGDLFGHGDVLPQNPFVEGVSYLKLDFTVISPNSNLELRMLSFFVGEDYYYSYANGMQIVPIPTPGALSMLGIAVLANHRRRR